jgi:hypothetical protein
VPVATGATIGTTGMVVMVFGAVGGTGTVI